MLNKSSSLLLGFPGGLPRGGSLVALAMKEELSGKYPRSTDDQQVVCKFRESSGHEIGFRKYIRKACYLPGTEIAKDHKRGR